jgi:hypothetical protein
MINRESPENTDSMHEFAEYTQLRACTQLVARTTQLWAMSMLAWPPEGYEKDHELVRIIDRVQNRAKAGRASDWSYSEAFRLAVRLPFEPLPALYEYGLSQVHGGQATTIESALNVLGKPNEIADAASLLPRFAPAHKLSPLARDSKLNRLLGLNGGQDVQLSAIFAIKHLGPQIIRADNGFFSVIADSEERARIADFLEEYYTLEYGLN